MPDNFSNFTQDKIGHLKRAGLVGAGKTGYGMNGGACPDWLVSEQVAENKRLAKMREQAFLGGYGGQKRPDIEWFVPAASEKAA